MTTIQAKFKVTSRTEHITGGRGATLTAIATGDPAVDSLAGAMVSMNAMSDSAAATFTLGAEFDVTIAAATPAQAPA